MKNKSVRIFIVLISVLIIAGCPAGPKTAVLESTAALDGEVTAGGAVSTGGEEVNVGDTVNGTGSRGFFSFDVSGIAPADTADFTVDRVVLKLTMTDWFGFPIDELGNVVVELVEYGTALDASDFGTAALGSSVILAADAVMLTDYEADLTSPVSAYIASGDTDSLLRWQFRIRHTTESNGDDSIDETEWGAAENTGDIYRPELTVTYR
jgi:hypothetical protein